MFGRYRTQIGRNSSTARINKESGTEPLGTSDTPRNLSSGMAAIVPQLHLEAQGSMMRPQLRS